MLWANPGHHGPLMIDMVNVIFLYCQLRLGSRILKIKPVKIWEANLCIHLSLAMFLSKKVEVSRLRSWPWHYFQHRCRAVANVPTSWLPPVTSSIREHESNTCGGIQISLETLHFTWCIRISSLFDLQTTISILIVVQEDELHPATQM